MTTPNVQSGQAGPAGRRGRPRRRRLTAWPPRRLQQLGLRLAGAGLLAATGAIHLDLYLTGYRSIPTLGWLFLLQVIAAFGLAAAVLASGSRLIAAAGAGFALATLGGYLLSVWIGLFGFKEVRTTAGIVAGVIEVAAFAALAGGPALSPAGGTLKTARIGGVTVLTNASGFTLYWFVPDTATRSACYGTCAGYWPPLTETPSAGPGVTGTLATIKRSDGTTQVTYNGHPLYTYVGDTAPGQAFGNNLNLNGGLWHEVTVSG